ncbi:MAG TPA: crosslink repair DNA glycosylase YcaQ family protein [Acidimicrobiales bacterium]|nr:crosslink repair DNA glycosylase YcaQ family protein [Acidimicrobiales bacterium]
MTVPAVGRSDVLRYRFQRQELDREAGTAPGPHDVAVLDHGIQDTGPDGAAWALSNRGARGAVPHHLALAWTLRGAPHAYRRADLTAVALATAPLSEADAGKRIFDAAKPLKAAGITVLDALRTVAGHLRDIVTEPMVKGQVSGRLTEVLDPPFLRFCRPCDTTHIYEMPFRLASLQAGLELEPGTAPPVLRRAVGIEAPMVCRLAGEAEPRVDVIRNYIRFHGPARPRDVAAFLDAPVRDVKAHWPADAVEVTVDHELTGGVHRGRCMLAGDIDALTATVDRPERSVRLLGPYDPYLQLRDRDLLVLDEARRKQLWPVLGRPGAIVAAGEIVGTWRPRASRGALTVRIQPWQPLSASVALLVEEQAERLSAHRDVSLAGIVRDSS